MKLKLTGILGGLKGESWDREECMLTSRYIYPENGCSLYDLSPPSLYFVPTERKLF